MGPQGWAKKEQPAAREEESQEEAWGLRNRQEEVSRKRERGSTAPNVGEVKEDEGANVPSD